MSRNESNRRSRQSDETVENVVAAVGTVAVGAALLGGMAYFASRMGEQSTPNTTIAVDATDRHGGGVCIRKSPSGVRSKHYSVDHDYNRYDPSDFEYRNSKVGMDTFKKDMRNANVTVYTDNTAALHQLNKEKAQLEKEYNTKSLDFQYNERQRGTNSNLRGLADDLSRRNEEKFKTKMNSVYPDVKYSDDVSGVAKKYASGSNNSRSWFNLWS